MVAQGTQMTHRPYYPGGNNPLHAVKDWRKVRSMIRALRRGEGLPMVYMDGKLGSGNWLSGTHRVAASEIRAKLDGVEPYADLDLCNVGGWLRGLTEEQRGVWLDLHCSDSESAVDMLDEAQDSDQFASLIDAMVEAQS